MSSDIRPKSGQHQEVEYEREASILSPSGLSFDEAEQARQTGLDNVVDDTQRPYALPLGSGQEYSQSMSNRIPVIDLTMEDEIVVRPRTAPQPPDRAVSSRPHINTLPDRVAMQLEEWYAYMDRRRPPPCAVGPRIKSRLSRFKPDRFVFWSYMGLEEVSITTYELAEFKEDIKRHIIVAQGPTKGPFIIKCFPKDAPVSYRIWNGWNGRGSSFEARPSIIKWFRSQENVLWTTPTVAEGSVRLAECDRTSPRVLDNNARTQPSTPELPGYIPYPQLSSRPQMTRPVTKSMLAQEKSSEEAQDAILGPLASQSPAKNNNEQGLLLNQGWNHDPSASRMGPHTTLQIVDTALPMTAHRNTNQILVTELPHPASSMPQCPTPSNVPTTSMKTIPPTLPPSPALAERQSAAKGPMQEFTLLEQQIRPSKKSPDAHRILSQPTIDKAGCNIQGTEVGDLESCQNVLTEMMDTKHLQLNHPFLQPVDPIALNIPTYFQIIQKPIDLSTIQQKLATGQYYSAEDFKNDMCLMFRNCSNFNQESDSVYKSGQLLNDLFLKLWARRTSSGQDDFRLREVDVQPLCEATEFILPQEPRLATEPFTMQTNSVACATQGLDIEDPQLLAPAIEASGWVQTSKTPVLDQCMSQNNCLPARKSPDRSQGSLISSDTQRLLDSSNRGISHPSCASLDSKHEHQIADHALRTRSASAVLSDPDRETLRSSREPSYTSEMLIETEREFSRAESGDRRAVISTDGSAQERPEIVCRREPEGTGGNLDGDPEGTSVKRQLIVHPSQFPSEAQFQVLSEEAHSEMLNNDHVITSLMNQSPSWQEVYECHGKVFEKTTGEDTLGVRHQNGQALRTDQPLVNRIEEADNHQSETVFSKIQPTSFCPVQLDPARSVHGSSPELSEDASGSEYHESPSPHAKPSKRGPPPLHCSYDGECRQTFTTKHHLNKHIKTVHLRTKDSICPSCGRRFARSNYLTLHLRARKCLLSRPLESDEHTNKDRACESRTGTCRESQSFCALSKSAAEQSRSDTAVGGPEFLPDGASLPSIRGSIISQDGTENAEEAFNMGISHTDRSEKFQKNVAATNPAGDQLPGQEEQLRNDSSGLSLQAAATPRQKPLPNGEAITETQRPITEQEGSDVDASTGENTDQEYSAQDNSEAGVSEFDHEDSESEKGCRIKQKRLLVKLPVTTNLTNVKSPTVISSQDLAKVSEVVDGKQKCGLCKAFNIPMYTRSLSSKTDCYICRTCQNKEDPEKGDVEGKERCADCDIPGRHLKRRKTNANGEYICSDCQEMRDCHDNQPLPKPGKTRARVATIANRRCDDCGGDRKKSNWRRSPDREGGYLCRPCSAYLGKKQMHRRPNEGKTKSVEEAREETPMPHTEQEYDLNRSPITSQPLEQKTIEDDDLLENPTFAPSKMIDPDQLRNHIRDNVIFLFYTDTGKRSATKSFGHCESVAKLFGQALGAKVFGLEDERLKEEGNVLKICFGAGQSGVGQDLRVIEEDKESFEALLDAIEQRDWWSERNGAVTGCGILEVRAAVKGK